MAAALGTRVAVFSWKSSARRCQKGRALEGKGDHYENCTFIRHSILKNSLHSLEQVVF